MVKIYGPDGNVLKRQRKRKKGEKRYLFSIDGQIYEADSKKFLTDLNNNYKQDLVNQTTLQAAFMAGLKNIMEYWHARPGLHPNIVSLTTFEKEDEERLEGLQNTLELFAKAKPPIKHEKDFVKIRDKMTVKMFDSISEMQDAWTKDGKLKPGMMQEYMEAMKEASSSFIDMSTL